MKWVTELQALGVQLSVDGDRLRCRGPEAVLTVEVRAKLAAHKAELLEYLRPTTPNTPPLPTVIKMLDGDRVDPTEATKAMRTWPGNLLSESTPA